MEYFETIVNVATGETTHRPYTEEEIAEIKANEAKSAELIAAKEKRNLDRLALLNKLGITEEEAKLLLG